MKRCAACGAPTAGTVTYGSYHRACVERLLATQVAPRTGR